MPALCRQELATSCWLLRRWGWRGNCALSLIGDCLKPHAQGGDVLEPFLRGRGAGLARGAVGIQRRLSISDCCGCCPGKLLGAGGEAVPQLALHRLQGLPAVVGDPELNLVRVLTVGRLCLLAL